MTTYRVNMQANDENGELLTHSTRCFPHLSQLIAAAIDSQTKNDVTTVIIMGIDASDQPCEICYGSQKGN